MKSFATIVSTVAVLLTVALIPMQTAQADIVLTGSDNLDDGAPLGPSDINPTSGDGYRATPYLYTLTDNLDLDVYKLYTTKRAEKVGNTGYGTSFALDMGGFDVLGTSGNVSISTIASAFERGAGSVTILNAKEISIGAIETYTSSTRSAPGRVVIGQPGTPITGDIRIDSIAAYSSSTSITGVEIYGSGDIKIQTDTVTPQAGDILTYATRNGAGIRTSDVVLSHDGDFVANDILNNKVQTVEEFGNHANMGSVQLDGGSATGSAVLRDINTSLHVTDLEGNVGDGSRYWGSAGNVSITNYQSVTVRSIDTHHTSGSSDYQVDADAGDVTISGITGDINILGSLDLGVVGYSSSQTPGVLSLQAGGAINLAELDMGKVDSASLDGVLSSMIDKLLSFDTTSTSGSGATSDPFITTQTALRTPAGEIIYYDAAASENAYLGGATYLLADLDGNAGQGGLLTPVPEPTTLALLSLGGLLGLTGMARRRRRQ